MPHTIVPALGSRTAAEFTGQSMEHQAPQGPEQPDLDYSREPPPGETSDGGRDLPGEEHG